MRQERRDMSVMPSRRKQTAEIGHAKYLYKHDQAQRLGNRLPTNSTFQAQVCRNKPGANEADNSEDI